MIQKLIQKYGRRKHVIVLAVLILSSAILTIPIFPASVVNAQVVLISKPVVSSANTGSPIEFTVSFLPSSLTISDPVATDLQLMVTTPSGEDIVLDESLDFRTPESFTRTVVYTPTAEGKYTFRAGMLVHSESSDPSDNDPPEDSGGETTTYYPRTGGGGGYYAVSVVSVFDLMAGSGQTEYYNTREVTISDSSSTTSTPVGGSVVSFPNILFIVLSISLAIVINRRKKNDQI